MDNRNTIGFRISVNATAKAARQAHQVRVVQRLLRSGQGLPPHPETAGGMPHAEKSIQYDPIHTIVAAGQQFRIPITQRIWHVSQINMRRSSCKLLVLSLTPSLQSAKEIFIFLWRKLLLLLPR